MRFAAIYLVLLAIAAVDIVIAEDQSVPDGTIYGHVYDAQTNQLISGAFVYCQETKCSKQLTDSDGYYAIENCFSPSSTYTIECTKYGYQSIKKTAKTNADGKAEVDFNLELPDTGSLVTNVTINLSEDELLNVTFNDAMQESSLIQQQSWKKTFGEASDFEDAFSVQQTSDEGYIVAGYKESSIAALYALLIKTDSHGNKVWQKTFERCSTCNGDCCSVQQTNDGGYVIAGAATRMIESDADIWVTRTNSQGNVLWDKTFGGQGFWCILRSAHQTNDGGYIVACHKISDTGDTCEVWLIKIDENGNKQWDRTLGGSACNEGCAVQQTSDGGYVIASGKKSYSSGNQKAWLIKTDPLGNMQWDQTFGDLGYNVACSVQQTRDDGYIIAGITNPYGTNNGDVWLIKTDSQGIKQWDRTFGGSGADAALSIQQTGDSGYFLVGSTESFGAGYKDIWLIKTDSQGNEEWDKTFGGPGVDEAYSGQQTSDGGYIVAGMTMVGKLDSYGFGDGDILLIKTDSEGNVEG